MADQASTAPGPLKVAAERCTGCHICTLACSLRHTGLFRPAAARLRVEITRNLTGPHSPPIFDRPVVCGQCRPAPCAEACPEEAISYHGEVVFIDEEACLGCGLCLEACPEKVMGLDEDSGRAYKCDLCGGEPQCVAVCPAAAIIFQSQEAGS